MKTKVITSIGIGALALSLGHSTVGAQEKGTITASALNVRSGPGLNYNTKGCLYKGDTVAVLDKEDGWIKVQLPNNTTGWVSEKYVEVGSSSSTNINIKINTSARLNVRSGPGTSYSIKTSVKNGEVYKSIEKSKGWYKIQLSNGTTGWVSGSYVKETTENISTGTSENTDNKQDTNETEVNSNGKATTALNVRSGPATSYSVKTILKQGEVVNLTKSSNGWYQVKTSSNITGWVSGKYITLTNEKPNDNTISSDDTSANSKTEAIIKFAMEQLGKSYVWGGSGPNSFDCSGFTKYVYSQAAGVTLPRISYEQAKSGISVSKANLKKGDLLHFATVTPGVTSHVGIYIGDNQFIHASGSQRNPDKVKISSLSGYYGNILLGARRLY